MSRNRAHVFLIAARRLIWSFVLLACSGTGQRGFPELPSNTGGDAATCGSSEIAATGGQTASLISLPRASGGSVPTGGQAQTGGALGTGGSSFSHAAQCRATCTLINVPDFQACYRSCMS